MIVINGKEYLGENEASKYLGKGGGWLAMRRSRELDKPRCYTLGKRRLYLKEDLDCWQKNRLKLADCWE